MSGNTENHTGTPQMSTTFSSQRFQRSGKRRSNRKRRCRSRNSVEDDSFHDDNFGPNAFWQNYQKAFQWGNNQEVAYWRSKAVALELENKMLRLHISRLSFNDKNNDPAQITSPVGVHSTCCDMAQDRPSNVNTQTPRMVQVTMMPAQTRRSRKKNSKKNKPKEVIADYANDSQLEFEVTEEMKDFFELHMRHKMEQEKQQLEDEKKIEEAASAAGEENAKLISYPINFGARADELKVLYGDSSPTIHGMEAAIQLTFRRLCEKAGARLWPNIPLRL